MKCNPRVVKLEGIQATSGNVEPGNHLRAFVGVEHGFFKDALTVYRRPAADKQSRLRIVRWPIHISSETIRSIQTAPGQAAPIAIETTDPLLTLQGSLAIDESQALVTLNVSFPSLVGYLILRAFPYRAMASSSADMLVGTDVLTGASSASRGAVRKQTSRPAFTLRNRGR